MLGSHPLYNGEEGHPNLIDLHVLLDLVQAVLVVFAVQHLPHLMPKLLLLCGWDGHLGCCMTRNHNLWTASWMWEN